MVWSYLCAPSPPNVQKRRYNGWDTARLCFGNSEVKTIWKTVCLREVRCISLWAHMCFINTYISTPLHTSVLSSKLVWLKYWSSKWMIGIPQTVLLLWYSTSLSIFPEISTCSYSYISPHIVTSLIWKRYTSAICFSSLQSEDVATSVLWFHNFISANDMYSAPLVGQSHQENKVPSNPFASWEKKKFPPTVYSWLVLNPQPIAHLLVLH